ncbi:MAG: AraC family transcriptional regulator [Variovorax paradoxus]|uniref:AraC family transcriptional regulator n=1 Tax=Variovorax paradoxus TaxID=34073 RepID=A0A2W5PL00_VARPD|nr:MAG: AraC family transcriptional regulator [Variovorax paradoxus]
MNIGMLVFPDITAIDYVAPADLLVRIPGATLNLVWKHTGPIRTELGWEFRPTASFESCAALDMLVVPGGPGIGALLDDEETLRFLARQASGATWIVGICTGPLVLGAAGLLEGYRATCHWASRELLELVGAVPVDGVQLFAEYDPQPPFDTGSPHKAPAAMVAAARTKVRPIVAQRAALLSARRRV